MLFVMFRVFFFFFLFLFFFCFVVGFVLVTTGENAISLELYKTMT